MKHRRRDFLMLTAASVAVANAALTGCARPLQQSVSTAGTESVLSKAVAQGTVPGVTAAVTNRRETVFAIAKGSRGLTDPEPMTLDTVMRIASMTKPITSVAAMQLVEQGRLSLDSPAAQVLPELGAIPVLAGWDTAGAPILRPTRTQITLRHLLTHTSGFVYDIWNPDLARFYSEQKIPTMGTGRKAALRVPLMFDPGDRWEYGIGIDWVGQLVEAASGMRLGEYIQRNVTGPLGMQDTAFKVSPSMNTRTAQMHLRDPQGKLSVIDFKTATDPEFESGGAGLYSTTNDYLKFQRMILNGGTGNEAQVLQSSTVTQMSTNAIGALRVVPLPQNIAMLSRTAEFFPGTPKTWSLGFMINEATAPTGRSAGSLAWAGLCNTYMWIDPRRDVAGVFMAQLLPFVDPQTLKVYYDFEKSVYEAMA